MCYVGFGVTDPRLVFDGPSHVGSQWSVGKHVGSTKGDGTVCQCVSECVSQCVSVTHIYTYTRKQPRFLTHNAHTHLHKTPLKHTPTHHTQHTVAHNTHTHTHLHIRDAVWARHGSMTVSNTHPHTDTPTHAQARTHPLKRHTQRRANTHARTPTHSHVRDAAVGEIQVSGGRLLHRRSGPHTREFGHLRVCVCVCVCVSVCQSVCDVLCCC